MYLKCHVNMLCCSLGLGHVCLKTWLVWSMTVWTGGDSINTTWTTWDWSRCRLSPGLWHAPPRTALQRYCTRNTCMHTQEELTGGWSRKPYWIYTKLSLFHVGLFSVSTCSRNVEEYFLSYLRRFRPQRLRHLGPRRDKPKRKPLQVFYSFTNTLEDSWCYNG